MRMKIAAIFWRVIGRRPWRAAMCVAAAAFVAVNALAFRHAWVMTHFDGSGQTTSSPEKLGMLEKAGVLLTGVRIPRPTNARTPADLSLPFETHRVPSSGGHTLEAWSIAAPDARAVVAMFHGYHSSKSALLNAAEALHELGCSVVLVDFRGSGGSTGNTTTLGIDEIADIAATCQLARSLAPDRPLVLFGQSMGSAASLRAMAELDLRPDGAILECPFDRLLTTVGHRFHSMGVPAFPFAHLLVFWAGVQNGVNGFAQNPAEYAARVTCPVLMFNGGNDPRVPICDAQAVCQSLAGTKRLEIFEGVGHVSCYHAQPEAWTNAVSTFLDELGSQAPSAG